MHPKRRDKHELGLGLRPAEFYLSRMGRIWVWMIACFAAGVILWFVVDVGSVGLIVMGVPLFLLSGRWDRLARNYRASMLQSGMKPLIRDWSLVRESLVHLARPARSRLRGQAGLSREALDESPQ